MIMTTVEHYMLFSDSLTNLHIVSGDHSLLFVFFSVTLCTADFYFDFHVAVAMKNRSPAYRDHNMSTTSADESFDASYPPESPTERAIEHSHIIRKEIREEEPEPRVIKPSEKVTRPSENGPRKEENDRPVSEVFVGKKIHVISFVSHTPSKRCHSC